MKLLVFADLHFVDYFKWREFLNIDHNRFDAVLLLGDIDIMFLKSIKENFSDKPIAGVLGNHDYPGDLEYYEIPNLHGKTAKIGDCRLLGVEGCVRYKRGEAPIHEQEEIKELLRNSPAVNMVLSHNSPKGIHDKAGIAHEGYEGLIEYMDNHSPLFILHGHQHINKRTKYKNTTVLGLYGGVILDTDNATTEIVLDLEQD
ncbi:Ser/Thr protein phosphatase [Bacillus sp. M6-12]|uniref:metallophosphoesterase family protein n=1 Tax=Bacillus sp. M6-12 TaxID=2054166 RepID=UPI000C792A53|nr:metallophosphoesterase family protein [Bacillus sp. M6-12]PLS19381.1 Ser/Thr protein phosphatase [Bacillus sp. M6-12]